jgi:hypothetical protein
MRSGDLLFLTEKDGHEGMRKEGAKRACPDG